MVKASLDLLTNGIISSDPEVQKQVNAYHQREKKKRRHELIKEGLIATGLLAILTGGFYHSCQQAKITLLHEQFYLPRVECILLQKTADFNPEEAREFSGIKGKYSCQQVEEQYLYNK